MDQLTTATPTADNAAEIASVITGEPVRMVQRFPTGLCHYVYDVVTATGRKLVVRVAERANLHLLAGGVYWSSRLRPKRIPLPELLGFDLDPPASSFPFMVLQRLEGTDLGHVYHQLSSRQKQALAAEVVRIQRQVGTLPEARGYGCSTSYESVPYRTWLEVIVHSLNRSRQWIRTAGVVDQGTVDRMERLLRRFEPYFASVRPTPFLDDTTTKNVLTRADGTLSGIVDVDEVSFGDPLTTVGLTQMALLGLGCDLEYIGFWCNELGLDQDHRDVLTFYTAESCVCFLGEVGQKFNRNQAGPVDRQEVRRLSEILTDLLNRIGG